MAGWPDRRLCDLLGVEHPVIQAPMAGSSTPALAAAVAARGGVGSLGLALTPRDRAEAEIREAQAATNGALNLNFFCHKPAVVDPARGDRAAAALAPYYAEYGLDAPQAPQQPTPPFNEDMLEMALAAGPRIASFHFGLPAPALLAPLKAAGIVILTSATSPAEAERLEAEGADAIIAQGWEAGGHRGVLDPAQGPGDVGTMALVPQIADRVSVPVIAAGGIADGRGIAAAFMLGASGVQMGTAFLRCPESAAHEVYRAALAEAEADRTGISAAFSGRPARGIVNRYMREMAGREADLPDFPLMNPLTGPLRAASARAGDGGFMSLWSGQGVGMTREAPAGELFDALVDDALRRLGARA